MNAPVTYITDRSMEGLLSAVFEAYSTKDDVMDILIDRPLQSSLDMVYRDIPVCENHAQRVYEGILEKISYRTYEHILCSWLSELPRAGYHILRYIRLGFQTGYRVDNLLTHPDVLYVHQTYRKVSFERHRFLGICRFSKMAGNYYQCFIAPDHHILPLIAPHFAARMADQRFILPDEKRDMSVVYDGAGEWLLLPQAVSRDVPLHANEIATRQMWKRYFDTIAIQERVNPKLQRQFLPQRYWRNLTEMTT